MKVVYYNDNRRVLVKKSEKEPLCVLYWLLLSQLQMFQHKQLAEKRTNNCFRTSFSRITSLIVTRETFYLFRYFLVSNACLSVDFSCFSWQPTSQTREKRKRERDRARKFTLYKWRYFHRSTIDSSFQALRLKSSNSANNEQQ